MLRHLNPQYALPPSLRPVKRETEKRCPIVLQYISWFIHTYAHRHRHAVAYTNIHGYENRQTAVEQYIYQIVKKYNDMFAV